MCSNNGFESNTKACKGSIVNLKNIQKSNGVPLLDLEALGLLGRRTDVARGLTGGVFTHKIIVIFVCSNYNIF